jgi:hypothetical protein
MANSVLTIDMVTKEALMIAHEKATFIGTTNRTYDDQFAKSGAKIGDTLRIRNPNAYTRRQGSRVMDVQDQSETSQSLTVATQDGVDMKFNSAELSLSIDEFSERYIQPAMSVLMSGVDGDYLTAMTKATYNVAGTAGTVVGASDITALGAARAKLNQGLAPKDQNRAFQIDSVTMGSIVNKNLALFQPSGQISEAFREGFYARSAMADFYENERTWTLTNGADVTGTTDSTGLGTAAADGSYTTVDIHTTVAVTDQVVGQVFTIAGVYACHPETKQSYGSLQQFTITAVGASLTTVSPTIYLTGARQNVCKSDSTVCTTTTFNSATLAFVGAASTAYRQNLMYHKDAFAFVTADLPLMSDAASCVRMNKDGLALRVWKGSDIRNDELLMRIDILYGWKALRPEWACRITN